MIVFLSWLVANMELAFIFSKYHNYCEDKLK